MLYKSSTYFAAAYAATVGFCDTIPVRFIAGTVNKLIF